MASIILGGAASILGQTIAGPVGAAIGYSLGSSLGGVIDQKIFGARRRKIEGPRLAELLIQTSTYGKMIPIIYGKSRIAGNIIWTMPIREEILNERRKIRVSKISRVKQSYTQYRYTASFAVALCEGEIDDIARVWADDQLFDLKSCTYRLYRGREDQMPDHLIAAIQGLDKTPAYRGLAYIIFENLPLETFGNRIPNFTFEIERKLNKYPDNSIENLVQSMTIIPGSGECVYDTKIQYKSYGKKHKDRWIQMGPKTPVNQNNDRNLPDAVLATQQLKKTFPQIKWVAPVVSWFISDLDITSATIEPYVEYKDAVTLPDDWHVANYRRSTAPIMPQDAEKRPIYGGTPSDNSIVNYIDHLRDQNYKIMFNPMLFVNLNSKPWRGRITGPAECVENFFTKIDGYNNFILHYAKLLKGKIDAFLIGSELIGLTQIKTDKNEFPAVDALISLSAQVKEILGPDVIITYGADWSEYHHSENGWYNLDPLWSANTIDVIGINAYFPLTDNKSSTYDIDEIKKGWENGEGWDYYIDGNDQLQKPLSPAYAWKNIKSWWENHHFNPDKKKTIWEPKAKKIWFTEYGFPSIDCATNQPNIFFNPKSIEGGIPHHSNGQSDFKAQRQAIIATEEYWKNSDMVTNLFLWSWDSRPYPYWPNHMQIWSDGYMWEYGHWLNGKLPAISLKQILYDLFIKIGIEFSEIDVTKIDDYLEGYAITSPTDIFNILNMLKFAFFFEFVETNDKLKIVSFKKTTIYKIDSNDLIRQDGEHHAPISFFHNYDAPNKLEIFYLNKDRNYEQNITSFELSSNNHKDIVNLPLVLTDKEAKEIARINLENYYYNQQSSKFYLSLKYIYLEVGDVVEIDSYDFPLRITSINIGHNKILEVTALRHMPEVFIQKQSFEPKNLPNMQLKNISDNQIMYHIFSLPQENNTTSLALAATSLTGQVTTASLYSRINVENSEYEFVADIIVDGVIGQIVRQIDQGSRAYFDIKNDIEIILTNGTLTLEQGKDPLSNLIMIGDEIIRYNALTMIRPYHYILSKLERGLYGSVVTKHKIGERFISLNKINILPVTIDFSEHLYYLVPQGHNLSEKNVHHYTPTIIRPMKPQIYFKFLDREKIKLKIIDQCADANTLLDFAGASINVNDRFIIKLYDKNKILRQIDLKKMTVIISLSSDITDIGITKYSHQSNSCSDEIKFKIQ